MVLPSDLVLAFVLVDIAVILVAAEVLGRCARRIGQPTVVGHIVAGVLLGPTLLGPVLFTWGDPWSALHCDESLAATGAEPSIGNCLFPPQARSALGVIGQVALILYMFQVGLELDYTRIRGKGRAIITVAVGVTVIPLLLGLAIAPVLYDAKFVGGFGGPDQPSRLAFGLMVGAMLAVTAFPVMAHMLQEKGLSRSTMGSVGISSTAVLSVLMFLAVATAAGVAREESPAQLGLRFVIAGLFIGFLFLVVRRALAPMGRELEATGELTTSMIGVIFIVLFAAAYAADRIGINVIPGAFLVGAILPAREVMFREMNIRLRDLTIVVLLPIFLAFSGLNTDFTKLGASFLVGIALFLVAGIAGKWAGGAVSARAGGLSWPEGNVLGVLMNCRGLLVLVVALIALNEGVITAPLQVGSVLMALVTTMMTGPLFDRFSKRIPGEVAPVSEP